MTREEILWDAKECVCNSRNKEYGAPEDNFALIASLWTEYLNIPVSALDVSIMMILLKIARLKGTAPTDDCFIDICGYAACGGEIMAAEKEREQKNQAQSVSSSDLYVDSKDDKVPNGGYF